MQAAAVVGSCSTVAMSASSAGTDARGVVTAAPGSASVVLQLTRQWLAQLLGCLEATLIHVRLLGAAGKSSSGTDEMVFPQSCVFR